MRFQNAFSSETASLVTRRGITLFPDSEKARELGPWRERDDLAAELSASRAIFHEVFSRWPASIIAPDYTWNGAMEDIWASQDIRILQAKREQRNPEWGYGLTGRLRKLFQRKFDQLRHPDRKYLERNCRLEPVQAPDPQVVVQRCVADTYLAWQKGQPAIVETHRVNLAHLEDSVVQTGQEALSDYLAQISQDDHLPIFLTDIEIARLGTRGVSWVRRGHILVLRNASHTSRILTLDPAVLPLWHPGASRSGSQFLRIAALTTLVMADDGQFASCSFER